MSIIRKAIEIVIKGIKKLFLSPMPSLFDIVVCLGVIPIGYLQKEFQGFYLVFFTLFLLCLTMSIKRYKEYRNIWLTLLLLWSFAGIFVHSWVVNINSVCYKYLNFYLMSEGFIYILFGTLLFWVIATRGKNLSLLWITVPIALVPLYQKSVYCGQMSYLMALGLAIVIYSFIRGYIKVGILATLIIAIIAVLNYDWLCLKFNCRPYVWIQLCKEILKHPFVGSGFNKYLLPDNMIWVEKIGTIEYGWLFRQNDYLSIGAFLGFPILIPIIGFISTLIMKFKKSWKIIPILSFVLVCFFQITMFEPYKAFIIVTILGALQVE